MLIPMCPVCRYPNQAQANRCAACGADMPNSALWLDELAKPAPTAPKTPPKAPPKAPGDITLRDLPTSPTPYGGAARAWPPAPVPAPAPAKAHDDGLLAADTEPQQLAEAAAARAAKRASVRHARNRVTAATAPDTVPEVLVLDADTPARARLRDLLVAFGFGVHVVAEAPRAAALLAERPFVAAFFDIVLDESDGGAGIELCRQAKQCGTLVVLVAPPLSPVQRVRADLAGVDEVLAQPVARGDVARVLDARGVALPSDARRT